MEYNLQNIRKLVERYFEGETTLAQEATLRDYFNNCSDIPTDLRACSLLMGHCATAATERSRREISLKTKAERRPLRMTAVAAVFVAAILLSIPFIINDILPDQNNIVCYINGVPVTDHQEAMRYTDDAFEIINNNLQKPSVSIYNKTENSSTMERMGEMLNTLINEE